MATATHDLPSLPRAGDASFTDAGLWQALFGFGVRRWLCSPINPASAARVAPRPYVAAGLEVMISFGEPHPHLLCKPEERRTQQGNRDSEKKTGTIFMLQPEERAGKSNNQEQRRANPTKKG